MNQLDSLSCVFLIQTALSIIFRFRSTHPLNYSFFLRLPKTDSTEIWKTKFSPLNKKFGTNTRDRGEAPPQTHFFLYGVTLLYYLLLVTLANVLQLSVSALYTAPSLFLASSPPCTRPSATSIHGSGASGWWWWHAEGDRQLCAAQSGSKLQSIEH